MKVSRLWKQLVKANLAEKILQIERIIPIFRAAPQTAHSSRSPFVRLHAVKRLPALSLIRGGPDVSHWRQPHGVERNETTLLRLPCQIKEMQRLRFSRWMWMLKEIIITIYEVIIHPEYVYLGCTFSFRLDDVVLEAAGEAADDQTVECQW